MKNTLYIIIAKSLVALLPASQCLAQSGPSVTATNSAINPAKTSSVDDPGRIPYQFNAQGKTSVTPPVPLNKRLVVEHVSVSGQICPPPAGGSTGGTSNNPPACSGTFAIVNVLAVPVNGGAVPFSSFEPPVIPTGLLFAFDQPTVGFVDAGGHVLMVINSNASSVAFNFVVTGYLLDCALNPCAPILP